jgi:hypothetical protein
MVAADGHAGVIHVLLAAVPTVRIGVVLPVHLHALLDHAQPLFVIGPGLPEVLSVCGLHER